MHCDTCLLYPLCLQTLTYHLPLKIQVFNQEEWPHKTHIPQTMVVLQPPNHLWLKWFHMHLLHALGTSGMMRTHLHIDWISKLTWLLHKMQMVEIRTQSFEHMFGCLIPRAPCIAYNEDFAFCYTTSRVYLKLILFRKIMGIYIPSKSPSNFCEVTVISIRYEVGIHPSIVG